MPIVQIPITRVMDIFCKKVMGIWTVGITYNCNSSGSNQDIFTNEAPAPNGQNFLKYTKNMIYIKSENHPKSSGTSFVKISWLETKKLQL